VEVAGKTSSLHTLYDWVASVTLVTHAAAEKAGLKRVRQPTSAVAGLSGGCTVVNFHYMVPVVDGDGRAGREGHGHGPHRRPGRHGRAY
jgi:hypothetical protein